MSHLLIFLRFETIFCDFERKMDLPEPENCHVPLPKSREAGLHSSASLKIKSNTMKNTLQIYIPLLVFPRDIEFFS